MRRLAIVGGVVLAGAVIPSLALAGPSPDVVRAPTATYTQGHTPPALAPSYLPSITPVTPATCAAGPSPGFTPTRTTAPGAYTTTCDAASDPRYVFTYQAGTLKVLPALSVSRVSAVLVGGGSFPLEVTVLSSVTITVTLTHGSTTASHTQHVRAGRTLVTTALADAHGHRLARGAYRATITASTNGATTTKTLTALIGAGGPATEVALSRLPGGHLRVVRPLTFTFSRPVAGVKAYRPTISPSVSGHWSKPTPYQLVFTPTAFGFTPGATESFIDPYAVWAGTTSHVRSATVQTASLKRAEQLLAQLAYLPLKFTARTPVARTDAAQAAAATDPPRGQFTWRYRDIPSALKSLWKTDSRVMVQGAVKAFENGHGLPTDGVVGPGVWRALEHATISGKGNRFGYSFVHVYRSLPEHLVVWHNGRVAATVLVNTGIPGRETNYGVFPIYLREADGTMSGTNPNGSTYHDSGILWISYFSGGDALHEFPRPGYGYPQSLGCVEMTNASAHRVWQLTEIGTLVDTLA